MGLFRAQFAPVWMCPQIAGFPRNRACPLSTCESFHHERAPRGGLRVTPRPPGTGPALQPPGLLVWYSRLRAKLDSVCFPWFPPREANATSRPPRIPCEASSLTAGEPSRSPSPEGRGAANLGGERRPRPRQGVGRLLLFTLDCSLLGLRFKNHPVFKGVGGEGERTTWQRSRNQHYDNAIASLFYFVLAFPNPRNLRRWGSANKVLKMRGQCSKDVNQAYRVDVFIDHFSNMLIKFQIEIFIFMALLHDSLNTGGH